MGRSTVLRSRAGTSVTSPCAGAQSICASVRAFSGWASWPMRGSSRRRLAPRWPSDSSGRGASGWPGGGGSIVSSSSLAPASVYSWMGTVSARWSALLRASGTPFRLASATTPRVSSRSTSSLSI